MRRKWRRFKRRGLRKIRQILLLGIGAIFLGIGTIIMLSEMNPPSFENLTHQASEKEELFIQSLVPKAKELQAEYGIWPSLLIGQAILESDWGQSELAVQSNNLFGIKSSSDDAVYRTKEFSAESGWSEIAASFKSYPSRDAALVDYALLLTQGTQWNPSLYHGVISADTYQEAAAAIQRAGYATDPNYAEKVLALIERYELYQYD